MPEAPLRHHLRAEEGRFTLQATRAPQSHRPGRPGVEPAYLPTVTRGPPMYAKPDFRVSNDGTGDRRWLVHVRLGDMGSQVAWTTVSAILWWRSLAEGGLNGGRADAVR